MKNKIGFISIYSLSHFIVDFVCAIFILGKLPYIVNTNNEFVISVIVYNFFAFAFQVPIGYYYAHKLYLKGGINDEKN